MAPHLCFRLFSHSPRLPFAAQMRYDAAASRRIRGVDAIDADRRIHAQYYVHQVLDTDITNLRRVWRKVCVLISEAAALL